MNDAAIHGVDPRLLYGLHGILTKSRSGRESVNFRSAAFLPGLTLQNAGVAHLEIKNRRGTSMPWQRLGFSGQFLHKPFFCPV
jgi:hypothetical protein